MTKCHTCGWQSHATNHKCHQSPSTTTHTIDHVHPITHQSTHTVVHIHMVERLDDHTVMTNTPWFEGNHSLHQHHCGAQHPHPTHHSCRLLGGALAIHMPLCAPPMAWKAWCCACHVLPFHSFHSCPSHFPFHTACHWITVIAIQQRTRCGTGMSTRASSLCTRH